MCPIFLFFGFPIFLVFLWSLLGRHPEGIPDFTNFLDIFSIFQIFRFFQFYVFFGFSDFPEFPSILYFRILCSLYIFTILLFYFLTFSRLPDFSDFLFLWFSYGVSGKHSECIPDFSDFSGFSNFPEFSNFSFFFGFSDFSRFFGASWDGIRKAFRIDMECLSGVTPEYGPPSHWRVLLQCLMEGAGGTIRKAVRIDTEFLPGVL